MATLHVLAPFNNVPSQRFSTCAFAGETLRFPKMMRAFGHRVVEYANEGSESEADEHVVILSERERVGHFPDAQPYALSKGAEVFRGRLLNEMDTRVQPGDFVIHPFGFIHADVFTEYPDAIHVEIGVCYLDRPFGAYRIYSSDQWRHYHWGLADATGMDYREKLDRSDCAVIPMAFDADDWPTGSGGGDERGRYVAFLGRPVKPKGFEVVRELAARGVRIKVAGCSDPGGWPDAAEFLGPVLGRDRAALVGEATCVLMPTTDIEPFGAAGVEGMMTGTPMVSSDWGGFRDTVESGMGFRCKTIGQYMEAIRLAPHLSRPTVARLARERFSLDVVGRQYDEVFKELAKRRAVSAA